MIAMDHCLGSGGPWGSEDKAPLLENFDFVNKNYAFCDHFTNIFVSKIVVNTRYKNKGPEIYPTYRGPENWSGWF